MLIKVLHGDNKLLLCNSTCSVVNLIRYIQLKTGFKDKEIDLADETGLVVQLATHPNEYADKYAPSGTFILVEKKPRPDSGRASPKKNVDPFAYTSLLDNYEELYPNLIDFHTTLEKLVRKDRNKLLSPANATKSKGASPQKGASSQKGASPQKTPSPRSTKPPSKKKSASRANT